jgi:hypothetical protein
MAGIENSPHDYIRTVRLEPSPVKIKLIKAEIPVQYSLATQKNPKVSASIA